MVRSGAHRVVGGELVAPYGVAIRGRDASVSTCSVCPGSGEAWRISSEGPPACRGRAVPT